MRGVPCYTAISLDLCDEMVRRRGGEVDIQSSVEYRRNTFPFSLHSVRRMKC